MTLSCYLEAGPGSVFPQRDVPINRAARQMVLWRTKELGNWDKERRARQSSNNGGRMREPACPKRRREEGEEEEDENTLCSQNSCFLQEVRDWQRDLLQLDGSSDKGGLKVGMRIHQTTAHFWHQISIKLGSGENNHVMFQK